MVKNSAVRPRVGHKNVLAGLALVTLALLALAFVRLQNTGKFQDLIIGHDWSHVSGVKVSGETLEITSLNQAIIHQDGSKAQLNPPVAGRAPHLQTTGDFEIEADMHGIDDGASLQLYGQVPVIYDEWRQERPSVRVDVSGKSIEVRVWDGNASTPIDIRSYNRDNKNATKLIIKHQKGKFIIAADSTTLGTMPDHDVFKSGEVWFGLDGSDKGDGWQLQWLRVRGLSKGTAQIIDTPQLAVSHDDPEALRNLANKQGHRIQIGAAVSVGPLYTDPGYRNIALNQFNLVTLESSLKPQFIHPAENKYDFTDADNIVAMAEANQQAIHGHTLVFAKSNPAWMTDAPKEKLPKIMQDHITNTVRHFKGHIATWDVVNEPLSEKDEDYVAPLQGLRQSFWEKAMGESYIDQAFTAARAADPAAKLFMNDYGIEHEGKRWDALVALVQRLQERGVPIDGIGFESHVYQPSDQIDMDVLRAHIRTLASLGLLVRISEIDVTGKEAQFQNEQYAGALSVCLSEPTCTSYMTWGISDLYGSTTVADRYPLLLGTSLLWNKDMQPKPAYKSLQEVLKRGV